MDPTANLIEYMRLIAGREDMDRAAELAEALIKWTSGGGFAPDWIEVEIKAKELAREYYRP